jgi:peptide/nickel transport system ATP-binding protein
LTSLASRDMRQVRGGDIAMVFQDPMTSLNPTMTIGNQIAEAVRLHRHVSSAAVRARAVEVLGLVGMPQPEQRLDSYPHQLSGGMRQRVMIALALACEPRLLIADEPTTALDVTIQAQILELLGELRDRLSMGVLLVTHDLGVIAGHADRVLVMYAGRIVEAGPTSELFTRPRCDFASDRCRTEDPVLSDRETGHAYACFHPRPIERPVARSVVKAVARSGDAAERPAAEGERRLLELVDVHKEFSLPGGFVRRKSASLKAVSGVSLAVTAGETFALVGESGCGKSTTGRLIVGLEEPTAGTVSFDGETLGAGRDRLRPRDMQLVFQDPSASLDPRMKVGASLLEPLVLQRMGSRRERESRVAEMLDQVGLARGTLDRYPHEFSGGQRQRIGLARALMLNPRLIIADEPVSALDVSVQSQVLNLMKSLQKAMGLTYVVISHDLSVVKYLADRIGVMYLGKLVELGLASRIYRRPAHPYTAGLLQAIPEPDPDKERAKTSRSLGGELPSAINPPSGCRFRTRCPRVEDICSVEEPPLRPIGDGQLTACHFPLQAPRPTESTAGSPAA